MLGCALAVREAPLSWSLAGFSLLFSLLIQIATNFANDYYDFANGVDQLRAAGPKRAVASGWIAPRAMHRAMWITLGGAVCASLPLIGAVGLLALPFVVSSAAFAILYTGGPRPLGYLGLGELFVWLYFGPVALIGTYVAQGHVPSWECALLSAAVGSASCAILVANNLRDEASDLLTGKRTLVVRWGSRFGRAEFTFFVLGTLALPLFAGFWSQLLAAPLAVALLRQVWQFRTPREAESLLPKSALLLALTTLLLCSACLM